MGDLDLSRPLVWWCQLDDGSVIQHVTTAHEGHIGHRHCIPVRAVSDQEDREVVVATEPIHAHIIERAVSDQGTEE